MATIKTIAIVGATGHMGSAIAKSLSKKGNYRLLLMSNEQDKLVDLKTQIEKSSKSTEVFAISCAREASWEADIIIVATPYEAEKEGRIILPPNDNKEFIPLPDDRSRPATSPAPEPFS